MNAGRWWHGAVLYQVYVRSWRDSDGDGSGDLRGIIERLDHLSWLGANGLWLSPTMPSPDHDWGYDVSDYLDVHPGLGTLADLDSLIEAAGERGIRVLLDLVPNHSSSAHPWFIESAASRDSARRDYYVWADPAPGGGQPNNWRAETGEPAWNWDEKTGQYYLHNFLASQPDLNWWNPAVHEEFRRILRFWFDRGVAGFRIDVAHGLYKDAQLRDNPELPEPDPMLGKHGQRWVYNKNRPQTHGVFREWREIAERYDPPRLLLGETWIGDLGHLASFYGDDDQLQLGFNMPFLFAGFTEAGLSGVVSRTLAALPAGACPVWTASNHDVSRFPSRWCGGDQRKIRLALLVLATLPGTVVLYYGDEIGMTDVLVPPDLARDEMSIGLPPGAGRDRARTPMRWDSSPGAGFTDPGARPWLPIGTSDDLAGLDVASQRGDPGSVLSFCRELLRVRRERSAGQIGRYERLAAPGGAWRYAIDGAEVWCNFSDQPAGDPELSGEVMISTSRPAGPLGRAGPDGAALALEPWEGLIIRRSS